MRVLVATDLSERSKIATTLAAAIPWADGSQLRFLTVIEPVPFYAELSSPGIAERTRNAEVDVVTRGLRALARAVEHPSRLVEAKVRVGRPADEILAEASALDAELLVIGSRGRGAIATALLGSVAAEVVDRSPCPVLVARRATVTRLVVADDGSNTAHRAIDVVLSWPFLLRLPIAVVNVARVPATWAAVGGIAFDVVVGDPYIAALEHERAESARIANAAVARLRDAGALAHAVMREGDAAGEIVDAVADDHADLVVVGSRGHTGLRRLVLGSVARNVLVHAGCSVLVVPPERSTGR